MRNGCGPSDVNPLGSSAVTASAAAVIAPDCVSAPVPAAVVGVFGDTVVEAPDVPDADVGAPAVVVFGPLPLRTLLAPNGIAGLIRAS